MHVWPNSVCLVTCRLVISFYWIHWNHLPMPFSVSSLHFQVTEQIVFTRFLSSGFLLDNLCCERRLHFFQMSGKLPLTVSLVIFWWRDMKCNFLSTLERSNQVGPVSFQNTIGLIFALRITCKWPEIATAIATRTPPNQKVYWVEQMAIHERYKSMYISLPSSA